jgi:hypothetical protein
MVNERALDERLAALEVARAWSPRLIARLESHIRSSEDEALLRINPFNFAAEKHLTDAEVIDLLFYATSFGLFRMDWMLLCPKCSCVVESFGRLEGVHNQYHCFMCYSDYETVLDDYVAVSFTIDPEVREIIFHHPERLRLGLVVQGQWEPGWQAAGRRAPHRPAGRHYEGRDLLAAGRDHADRP